MPYRISKFVAGPLLKVLFQLKARGLENIPAHGKAILASNHFSFLDHFILPTIVDREITFIAKSELFENPIWGFLLTQWGQISLNRGTGDNSAVDQAIEVLNKGKLFGIYPEGTRTRDGKLHGGHTGVARISLISGAPVIPVGMIGTYEILPRGAVKPNFGKAEVRIGRPLDFTRHSGKENDRKITRMITDEIMAEIGKLIGQQVEGEIYRYDEILPKDHEE